MLSFTQGSFTQGALHSCMPVEVPWVPGDVLWAAMVPRDVLSAIEAEFC